MNNIRFQQNLSNFVRRTKESNYSVTWSVPVICQQGSKPKLTTNVTQSHLRPNFSGLWHRLYETVQQLNTRTVQQLLIKASHIKFEQNLWNASWSRWNLWSSVKESHDNTISGSSDCGWRRRPPDMDGRCKHFDYAVAARRQTVVL
jgi:hypothetical protein